MNKQYAICPLCDGHVKFRFLMERFDLGRTNKVDGCLYTVFCKCGFLVIFPHRDGDLIKHWNKSYSTESQ